MARKQPTPEQKAAAEARRDRFKQLAKEVAAMSDEARTALVMRAGAILTCEGRPLSPCNSCLILMQCSNASVVGGFWQWKDAGRSVKKGAHGLGIWIPTGGAKSDGPADVATCGEPIADAKESRARFIMGTVFDITQTEPAEAHELVAV